MQGLFGLMLVEGELQQLVVHVSERVLLVHLAVCVLLPTSQSHFPKCLPRKCHSQHEWHSLLLDVEYA